MLPRAMVSRMVLGFRAWCWMVAFGGAVACNPDTSGLGGGDTASVDPTAASTGGSSTGTTGTIAGSSSGAVDSTAASTGEPPGTEGSSTASVDTADTADTSTTPTAIERCNSRDLAIPDNDEAGVYSLINIPTSGTIVAIRVVVRVSHSFVGDLDIELTKDGPSVPLIDNPGGFLCSGNDIDVVLHDDAALTVDAACMNEGGATPALAGEVQPEAPLGPAFVGQDMLGNWRLGIADRNPPDMGTLTEWCLQIDYE